MANIRTFKCWVQFSITFLMPENLLQTLYDLINDKTVVVRLYQEIFSSNFFTLIKAGTNDTWDKILFCVYDTADEITAIPLFTKEEFIFENYPEDAVRIEIWGQPFWEKLLTIVETGKCEIEIDPGQPHGIRLNKEILLGMVGQYSGNL